MKVKASATLCTNGLEGKRGILGWGEGVRSARVELNEGGCARRYLNCYFPGFSVQKLRHSEASSWPFTLSQPLRLTARNPVVTDWPMPTPLAAPSIL
jgi:hypothetical protein